MFKAAIEHISFLFWFNGVVVICYICSYHNYDGSEDVHTIPALYLWDEINMDFTNCEFPQLLCLVGASRSNLVIVMKILS